jgi:predicted RNA-binding Zn-ribbon protein involved in translation (DUF1610 family)
MQANHPFKFCSNSASGEENVGLQITILSSQKIRSFQKHIGAMCGIAFVLDGVQVRCPSCGVELVSYQECEHQSSTLHAVQEGVGLATEVGFVIPTRLKLHSKYIALETSLSAMHHGLQQSAK